MQPTKKTTPFDRKNKHTLEKWQFARSVSWLGFSLLLLESWSPMATLCPAKVNATFRPCRCAGIMLRRKVTWFHHLQNAVTPSRTRTCNASASICLPRCVLLLAWRRWPMSRNTAKNHLADRNVDVRYINRF